MKKEPRPSWEDIAREFKKRGFTPLHSSAFQSEDKDVVIAVYYPQGTNDYTLYLYLLAHDDFGHSYYELADNFDVPEVRWEDVQDCLAFLRVEYGI
jgi:hypothetical protein